MRTFDIAPGSFFFVHDDGNIMSQEEAQDLIKRQSRDDEEENMPASPTNALAAERIADKRGFERGSDRWGQVHACAAEELTAAEDRGRAAAFAQARALCDGRFVPPHGTPQYRQGAGEVQTAIARAIEQMR